MCRRSESDFHNAAEHSTSIQNLKEPPFMSVQTVSSTAVAHALTALRANRPLVHCLTNEVVQEITANVLLAAGASPAMVVAMEEAPVFTVQIIRIRV